MKQKIIYEIMALAILSMLVLSGCSGCNPPVNQADKRACENSGGTYTSGFGETGGSYWYCSCPSGKYTDGNSCATITQALIDKCESYTNPTATFSNTGSYCRCTINSNGNYINFNYQKVVQDRIKGVGCEYDSYGGDISS